MHINLYIRVLRHGAGVENLDVRPERQNGLSKGNFQHARHSYFLLLGGCTPIRRGPDLASDNRGITLITLIAPA